jgi:hypothetical protein
MSIDTNGRVLILSDGGMPALIAAMHAREAVSLNAMGKTPEQIGVMLRDQVLLTPFGLRTESKLPQSRAVAQQASTLGVGLMGVGTGTDEIKQLLTVAPHADDDEREGMELLAVLLLAARLQCSRVVWPVHAGGHDSVDLDRLSQIADRALAASMFAGLCSSASTAVGLHVDTPCADLTDRQIADLAIDMDAPVDACWWWQAGDRGSEAQRERSRWMKGLQAMGWTSLAGAGA